MGVCIRNISYKGRTTILCDIDIPWEDDGTRYFPKQEDRVRFFDACRKELDGRGTVWCIVSGTVEERMAMATKVIDRTVLLNLQKSKVR
jgi:nicotinamide riboside kinase